MPLDIREGHEQVHRSPQPGNRWDISTRILNNGKWFQSWLVEKRFIDPSSPYGCYLENHPITLLETNIFAPKNGWLEYDCFLLGPGLFSGAFAVSFREGSKWFIGLVSPLKVGLV